MVKRVVYIYISTEGISFKPLLGIFIMPQRTTKHCFAVMTLFGFLAVMLIAAGDAAAQTYNLLVRVKGTAGANNQVTLTLGGGSLTTPVVNRPGRLDSPFLPEFLPESTP